MQPWSLLLAALLCAEAGGFRPDQGIENRGSEHQNPESDRTGNHVWEDEWQHAADGKIDHVLNDKPAPRKPLSSGLRPEGVARVTEIAGDRGRQEGQRIRGPERHQQTQTKQDACMNDRGTNADESVKTDPSEGSCQGFVAAVDEP